LSSPGLPPGNPFSSSPLNGGAMSPAAIPFQDYSLDEGKPFCYNPSMMSLTLTLSGAYRTASWGTSHLICAQGHVSDWPPVFVLASVLAGLCPSLEF
jgi:hypothetical protein